MRRNPGQRAAATTTTGRCGASVAGSRRVSVKRHRTQDCSPWVRSSSVFLFERAVDRRLHRYEPPFPGGLALSGPVVTSDTLVVDVAPKVTVVIGVGNCDLLAGLLHGGARQVQFGDVSVE